MAPPAWRQGLKIGALLSGVLNLTVGGGTLLYGGAGDNPGAWLFAAVVGFVVYTALFTVVATGLLLAAHLLRALWRRLRTG